MRLPALKENSLANSIIIKHDTSIKYLSIDNDKRTFASLTDSQRLQYWYLIVRSYNIFAKNAYVRPLFRVSGFAYLHLWTASLCAIYPDMDDMRTLCGKISALKALTGVFFQQLPNCCDTSIL